MIADHHCFVGPCSCSFKCNAKDPLVRLATARLFRDHKMIDQMLYAQRPELPDLLADAIIRHDACCNSCRTDNLQQFLRTGNELLICQVQLSPISAHLLGIAIDNIPMGKHRSPASKMRFIEGVGAFEKMSVILFE